MLAGNLVRSRSKAGVATFGHRNKYSYKYRHSSATCTRTLHITGPLSNVPVTRELSGLPEPEGYGGQRCPLPVDIMQEQERAVLDWPVITQFTCMGAGAYRHDESR